MEIANEANLLMCTNNLQDLAQKRSKHNPTIMLSHKQRW